MYNMSTAGCAIESDADHLHIGDAVSLAIEEFAPIDGKVAWARSNCAGISFDDPVHADIVMYVGFRDSVDLGDEDLRADQPSFAQPGFYPCPKVLVTSGTQAAKTNRTLELAPSDNPAPRTGSVNSAAELHRRRSHCSR